jgi:hypothetical protein
MKEEMILAIHHILVIAIRENGIRIVNQFNTIEKAIECLKDLKKDQIWGPITDSPVEHLLRDDGQTSCGWYYTKIATRVHGRKYRKCKLCYGNREAQNAD